MKATTLRPFRFKGAKGTDYLSILNNGTSGNICWTVADDGTINYAGSATPIDYPFELVPYSEGMGIHPATAVGTPVATTYYSLSGQRLCAPQPGIVICRTAYADGTVSVRKVLIK